MSSALSPELQKAIAAAHAGDIDQARTLADRVIQDEPENENALFLLSALVDSDEERQAYLSQVLLVNPEHPGAQKYLDDMDESTTDKSATAAAAVAASATVVPDSLPIDETVVAQSTPSAADETVVAERGALAEIESEEEIVILAGEIEEEFDELEDAVIIGTAAAVVAEDIEEMATDSESLYVEDASDSVPDWLLDDEEHVDERVAGANGEGTLAQDEQVADWLTEEPVESFTELDDQIDKQVVEQRLAETARPASKKKPASQRGPSDRVLTIILILLAVVAFAIVAGIIVLAINRPLIT